MVTSVNNSEISRKTSDEANRIVFNGLRLFYKSQVFSFKETGNNNNKETTGFHGVTE